MEISKTDFLMFLREAASKETSANPNGWTKENPLWGHCTVAALLAQDYFGGEIMRGSLLAIPKYAHLHWHYWNKFDAGELIDFTSEQYPDLSFHDLVGEVRSREKDLRHEEVLRRYVLLKERLERLRADT